MAESKLDFQEIYDCYQPKIAGYVRRLAGDADAEDLTQEVFIRVSRALPDFRGESSLPTWIYRIATNAALDRLRSPSFYREEPAGDEEMETAGHDALTGRPAVSVEQQVVRQEMDACIQDFIMRLPENYRAVFVLADLEGLSNKDIAEILGVSLHTAKIRLHRARMKLREDLAKNCDPGWAEDNEFVPALWRTSGNSRKTG